MPKKDSTDGERLCTYVKKHVVDDAGWSDVPVLLVGTGRDAEWTEFFREVVATQLVGRLVAAGVTLAGGLSRREATGDVVFGQRLKAAIQETTRDGIGDRKVREKVFELTRKAVLASYGDVTVADEKALRDEATRPPRCYLCNRVLLMLRGADLESLDEDDRELAVEYEHVWPRSYGGNTDADNLALACHGCNRRKNQYANWAMVDIQSLVFGLAPSDGTLERVEGWRRFALTSRLAHALADRESLTLKQAFVRLTPRVASRPKVRRVHDAADFFNLTLHEDDD